MVLLQTLLFWNVGVGSNTNSFSSSLISDQPKKKMIGIIFEIFVWIIEISLVLVAIFFHWVGERNRPPAITRERDGDKVHVGGGAGSADAVLYRLHDLEIATNYFSDDNKIGKGGFGVVYKGLLDGQTVAVKKLNGSSVEREFVNEVSLLSSLKHNNLIKLLGFCCEAGNFLLVYEYALNGDLYHYLTDENKRQALNWEIRFEIIKGFARGLSYLHHDSQNPILHRDIKPANVLLDEHHCAKIADFGLSRTFDINKTHKTTKQLAGTMGYIAPELFFNQHFSTRSDVYSYGLLVLETLAGCTVHQYADANEDVLSHVVWKQWKDKKPLTEVIDTYLRDTCPQDQLMSCITIGLLCVQHDPKKRPNMKLVLEMLNNESPLPAPSSPAFFEDHSSTSIQLQCARPPHSSTSIQFSQSTSISSTSNPGLSGNGTTNPCPGSPSFSPPPTYRPPSQPKSETEEDPEVLLGRLKRFSWRELHVATDEFSNENLLGRGGFGKVYKGRLADGSLIAVKRQREDGNAGGELQFIMERAMTSRAVHRNLLRLCGFCITPTERLLVYPYMANGSLASKLRDRDSNVPPLDWPKRGRIALGAARGLSYLHDSCRPIIIHRDVKAANILLDEDFEAVLGDFGLVKFMDYQDTHVSTAVRGTIGHLAPEYLSTGKVSKKTDVFGYGIMLLELITGQRAFDLVRLANDDDVMLLDWVKRLLKDDRLEMLVDPDLRNNFIKIEVETLIQIALRCTQASPLDRPKMSEVVWMLEVAERWEWQKAPTKLETQLGSNINTDLTCSVSAIQLSGPR